MMLRMDAPGPIGAGTASAHTGTRSSYHRRNSNNNHGRIDYDVHYDDTDYSATSAMRTPLRRRENDSFAAPQYYTQPQQPQQPYVHVATPFMQASTTTTGGAFGELPFASFQRRRRYEQDKWIRYTMRAVLLSPIIVLVLWSMVSMLFYHKHTSQQQQQQQQQLKSNKSNTQHQFVNTNNNNNKNFHLKNRFQEGILEAVEVLETAFGNAPHPAGQLVPIVNPLGMPLQQQQQRQQQQQAAAVPWTVSRQEFSLPDGNSLLVVPMTQNEPLPRGTANYNNGFVAQAQANLHPLIVQPPFPNQMAQEVADQSPIVVQQQHGGARSISYPDQPEYATLQQLQQQQQQMYQAQQQQLQPIQDQPWQLPQQAAVAAADAYAHPQLRGSAAQEAQNLGENVQVLYYYYDPAKMKADPAGNVYLPEVVYNAAGQQVHLQALQESAPILYQPPPFGVFHHDNYTNNPNITTINVTHSHPNTVQTPVHDNRRGIRWNYIPANIQAVVLGNGGTSQQQQQLVSSEGSSTTTTSNATDQSILVCTVGVMALLVGAVSARRLRHSRSMLSACLENESLLQEDAAYDAAYTIVDGHIQPHGTAGASANQYNTFAAAASWKGDLEKFDV